MNVELDRQVAEILGYPWKRPTHGSCCTCQTCGWEYEECKCGYSDNESPDKLKPMEDLIEQRGLSYEYIAALAGVRKPTLVDVMTVWDILRSSQDARAAAFIKVMSEDNRER